MSMSGMRSSFPALTDAPDLSAPRKTHSPFQIDLSKPLTDVVKDAVTQIERQYIRKAMKKTRGHVGQCARICGLSRRSISAKLAEYGIKKAEFKEGE